MCCSHGHSNGVPVYKRSARCTRTASPSMRWSSAVGKCVKVSEGWKKGEGACEVDMCSSHVKDVSENVILCYLFTFYHLEAAESVCQSVHAACKVASERKISV